MSYAKGYNPILIKDEEQLMEDSLRLKEDYNKYRSENTKLQRLKNRFKVVLEEKDNKITHLIKELRFDNEIINERPYIVNKFLSQLCELNKQLKNTEESLYNLKRTLKFTKLKELKTGLKLNLEENLRLQLYLKDINLSTNTKKEIIADYTTPEINSMNTVNKNQCDIIANMNEKKIKLSKLIEEKTALYENQCRIIEQAEVEINNLKKQCEEEVEEDNIEIITEQINKLNLELSKLKTTSLDIENHKNEIVDLVKKNDELKKLLNDKNKITSEMQAELDKQEEMKVTIIALNGNIAKCQTRINIERPKEIPAVTKDEITRSLWILKLNFIEKQISPNKIYEVIYFHI